MLSIQKLFILKLRVAGALVALLGFYALIMAVVFVVQAGAPSGLAPWPLWPMQIAQPILTMSAGLVIYAMGEIIGVLVQIRDKAAH